MRGVKLFAGAGFPGRSPAALSPRPRVFRLRLHAEGSACVARIPYAADEDTVAEALMLMPQGGPDSFFKDGRVEPAIS